MQSIPFDYELVTSGASLAIDMLPVNGNGLTTIEPPVAVMLAVPTALMWVISALGAIPAMVTATVEAASAPSNTVGTRLMLSTTPPVLL